jgi:hypothetical protein
MSNFSNLKKKYDDCSKFQIYFTHNQENCCICYKSKFMIETTCKHRFCIDCLNCAINMDVHCHICKQPIEKK